MKQAATAFAAALIALPAFGGDALAHALAQRYDLPLPLGYFLMASGAVVVMTFVILALFWRGSDEPIEARDYTILRGTVPDSVVASLQIFTVLVLILLIAAGFFGNPDTFKNITPVAVWVIWWVGFGFLTAFVGNIWPLINPWSSVFRFAETLARPWTSGFSFRAHYPRWLGAWPSCVLFLLFAWLELVAPGREVPRNVAIAILIYSVFTWIGFVTFGRDTWLKNGEVFAVAFGLFGRFAPLDFTNDGRWRVSLRPFATGLLTRTPLESSMTAFSLLMLGTVTVDGFMETPLWAAVVGRVLTDSGSVDANPWVYMAMQTALLIAGPLTLTGLYLVVIALTTQISAAKPSEVVGIVCPLSHTHCHRISPFTLFFAVRDRRSVHHPTRVRPLRLRVGFVRHDAIPDRHRRRRCEVHLVSLGRCYCDGPHRCGVGRACHGVRGVRRYTRPGPKPISNARPDGHLHNAEPLDSCSAHCGTEHEMTPTTSTFEVRSSLWGCKPPRAPLFVSVRE